MLQVRKEHGLLHETQQRYVNLAKACSIDRRALRAGSSTKAASNDDIGTADRYAWTKQFYCGSHWF